MKTHFLTSARRGFTLMELMVAMSITTIIITILVGITSLSMDSWTRSRAEIRAARQAKAMIEAMGEDFQSMITRKGNQFEWLYANLEPDLPGDNTKSSNASNLIFFTAATDRYATATDNGGDISCVSYKLAYQDPIVANGGGGDYETFAVYRLLVEPDETFASLLGQDDLSDAFGSRAVTEKENFVCENVYQFTLTFGVEVQPAANGNVIPPKVTVPVTITQGPTGGGGGSGAGSPINPVESVRLVLNQLEIMNVSGGEYSGFGFTSDEIAAGRIVSVDISVTVLTDNAVNQLRVRNFASDDAKAEFIATNSFHYSKRVPITSM
jgi:prepilin-type N-terminal cleavage/methylation domain-containing protein